MHAVQRIPRSSPPGARAVPRACAVAVGVLAVLLTVLGAPPAALAQARTAAPETHPPSGARPLPLAAAYVTPASGLRANDAQPVIGSYDCLQVTSTVNACAAWDNYVFAAGSVQPSLPRTDEVCGTYLCSYLIMQSDGNLVLYHNCIGPNGRNHAVWASNTQYEGDHAWMQKDGNLVVYQANGYPVWDSGTDGYTDAWLAVQSDGNLVIYQAPDPPGFGSLHPVWATNTTYC
jgi:hypothetical protein